MKKSKLSIQEIAWLIVFALAFITSVHSSWTKGWKESLLFYVFCLLALAMFLLRRALRHRKEKQPGGGK